MERNIFILKGYKMKKLLCMLSLLIITQLSFAENDEGWCDFRGFSSKEKALENCQEGDILLMPPADTELGASACKISTIRLVGKASFVCEYRGSIRVKR